MPDLILAHATSLAQAIQKVSAPNVTHKGSGCENYNPNSHYIEHSPIRPRGGQWLIVTARSSFKNNDKRFEAYVTACIVAPSLCHEETRGDPTAFFRIYYHDNRKLVWHVTWRLEPTKGQWRLDEAHTTLDTIPESCKEDIKTGVYDNIEDLAKMLGTFATAMS